MDGTNYRFWDSRLEVMFSLVFRSDLFCDPLTSAYVMFIVLKADQSLLN